MQKQNITLSAADRKLLEKLISSGQCPARVNTRARILLQADQHHLDAHISQALDVGLATVGRIRRTYATGGLPLALYERARPGAARKLDPKAEALVIATACSPAPDGRSHWALRLLADKTVELGLVEAISYETIRRTLKKTNSSPGNATNGACQK